MPIAYYARSATREFWSEHWGTESPEALSRTAETSPLTALVLAQLPAGARVLEAGCGLGQYVALLRRRGYAAVGVDWSERPLGVGRAWAPGTPLAAMDLRRLGFRSGEFGAYVSLGVVEHDPEGPDAILAEARRVLAPGGVLLLSVPYVNAARRAGAWWIRWRNRRVQAAGGEFYQFALSRGEVRTILERNGFRVLGATPYDPARILRGVWRRLARGIVGVGGSGMSAARDGARARTVSTTTVNASRGSAAVSHPPGALPARPARGAGALAKRLLYTRPVLHAFGHMILFAAVRR